MTRSISIRSGRDSFAFRIASSPLRAVISSKSSRLKVSCTTFWMVTLSSATRIRAPILPSSAVPLPPRRRRGTPGFAESFQTLQGGEPSLVQEQHRPVPAGPDPTNAARRNLGGPIGQGKDGLWENLHHLAHPIHDQAEAAPPGLPHYHPHSLLQHGFRVPQEWAKPERRDGRPPGKEACEFRARRPRLGREPVGNHDLPEERQGDRPRLPCHFT